MKLTIQTEVTSNIDQVFKGFNEELFAKLTPPLMPGKLIRFDGSKAGDEVHLDFPLGNKWVSHIVEDEQTEDGYYFKDIGVKLPFPLKKWEHQHIIKKSDQTGSIIIDDIDYQTFSRLLDFIIFPFMWLIFTYRKPIYKKSFQN